ncbi:unnamed protein product [Arctogadus glacialis]
MLFYFKCQSLTAPNLWAPIDLDLGPLDTILKDPFERSRGAGPSGRPSHMKGPQTLTREPWTDSTELE